MAYLLAGMTLACIVLGAMCVFMGMEHRRYTRELHRRWNAVPHATKELSSR